MPDNTILHRCGSLIFGERQSAISVAKKRSSSRMIRVEVLESRTVLSVTTVPVQFSIPDDVYPQNFYVSITAQLNANYVDRAGNTIDSGAWVYYVPGTNGDGSPNYATGDYVQATASTPDSALTFQVTASKPSPTAKEYLALIDIPQTDVVSGHIVMGVGSAPDVSYAINPTTHEAGISAPSPNGLNFDKIYGLFEYAMSGSSIDVDSSVVDQVGFPFTITSRMGSGPQAVYQSVGMTPTRTDLFNLYQLYINEQGPSAAGFRALLSADGVRIMAPNNYVSFAPQPSPIPTAITTEANGHLQPSTMYYYWVTATNGYGETQANNPQNTVTAPDSTPQGLIPMNTIRVSWEPFQGATGYNIYRNTSNDPTTAVLVGKSSTTHYKDMGDSTPISRPIPTNNYTFYPQNYYFNNELYKFYTHYSQPNSFNIAVTIQVGQNGSKTYDLSGQVNTAYPITNSLGKTYNYVVLELTGTDPDIQGQTFLVMQPFFRDNTGNVNLPPAPDWMPHPEQGPGVMVFANDGVFNTGGAQPGVNADVLSNLENSIVSAFNRGIATNFKIAPNNWANAPGVTGSSKQTGGSLTADAYYYVITSTNSYGETTASSELMQVITAQDVQNNTRQVELTWTAYNTPTQYNIYRSTTQGSGYQLIASVPNPNPNNHNIPVTSFTDPGLAPITPTPGHPAPAALTPELYYAPGTTSNWYAGFMHQNSTDNPATGVSIDGLAYAFGYDDQGGNSTNMENNFSQIYVNLQPWAASQTPPVNLDPTPNAPLAIQILNQPKSVRAGSFTTIGIKAFGPNGGRFVGGTQVAVELIGVQRGSYVINVNPVTGLGYLTFKSTETGFNYLKLTQSDGKTYHSKVFNTLPTSIPLSLMYIFDRECERLSRSAGFYASLDRIARSRR